MSTPTLLVGGAPITDPAAYTSIVHDSKRVVAVDAGLDLCRLLGVVPQVVVGDMDSVSAAGLHFIGEHGIPVVKLDTHKDYSDLDAALAWAEDHESAPLEITAICSGRLDHQLAVFGSIAAHASRAPVVREPSFCAYVLGPGGRNALQIEGEGTVFSVTALLGPATVSISGARYPLTVEELAPLSSRGVSNVVESSLAEVHLHSGIALAVVHAHEV